MIPIILGIAVMCIASSAITAVVATQTSWKTGLLVWALTAIAMAASLMVGVVAAS